MKSVGNLPTQTSIRFFNPVAHWNTILGWEDNSKHMGLLKKYPQGQEKTQDHQTERRSRTQTIIVICIWLAQKLVHPKNPALSHKQITLVYAVQYCEQCKNNFQQIKVPALEGKLQVRTYQSLYSLRKRKEVWKEPSI